MLINSLTIVEPVFYIGVILILNYFTYHIQFTLKMPSTSTYAGNPTIAFLDTNTVNSLLTDTYKMDTSVRQTVSVGPDGVRLRES